MMHKAVERTYCLVANGDCDGERVDCCKSFVSRECPDAADGAPPHKRARPGGSAIGSYLFEPGVQAMLLGWGWVPSAVMTLHASLAQFLASACAERAPTSSIPDNHLTHTTADL